jgi:hypothetical protein
MNLRQAAELKRAIEATHPDAGITVTPGPDGAQVTISSPPMAGNSSGPGGIRDVTLQVGDGGALWRYFMNRPAPRTRGDG